MEHWCLRENVVRVSISRRYQLVAFSKIPMCHVLYDLLRRKKQWWEIPKFLFGWWLNMILETFYVDIQPWSIFFFGVGKINSLPSICLCTFCRRVAQMNWIYWQGGRIEALTRLTCCVSLSSSPFIQVLVSASNNEYILEIVAVVKGMRESEKTV